MVVDESLDDDGGRQRQVDGQAQQSQIGQIDGPMAKRGSRDRSRKRHGRRRPDRLVAGVDEAANQRAENQSGQQQPVADERAAHPIVPGPL